MKSQNLIIIVGLPGVGKSTLAESVAKKLSLPFFSVDPIESAIIKSGIKRSFETGLAAYLVAETLASEHLKLGQSLIIDSVSAVKEARDMWHNLEITFNASLKIIECLLEEEIHKKRIRDRVRSIDGIPEVTWEEVEKRKKEYLPWEQDRLIIDTSLPNEINLARVLEYVNTEFKP